MSLALTLGVGCAAKGERALREDLARAGQTLAELPADFDDVDGAEEGALPNFDGTPQSYVDYALVHDHRLRAGWERWRAATHRIARERRMPMPMISYGVFVSPVETRVGPQRQRLSLRQSFPWPGELLAGADAATAAARAMQREFEAQALELRATVLRAYWQLWLIRQTRGVVNEQLELYAATAELARSRLSLGQVTLADVQQIDLGQARMADQLAGIDELELAAQAELLAAVAAPPMTDAPTSAAMPELLQPEADEDALRQALVDHPRLEVWTTRAEVGELRAKEARAARAPSFSVNVDWIEVGPARMSGVADSGKDAVMIGLGIDVPLWQGNYAHEQKAAEADAAAARSEWAAARDRAGADLAVTLTRLRDSARRVLLNEDTLIPQAQGALESTLGGYASGNGQLSAILLAQRELLELRLETLRLSAAHAVAWAELERVVGREVAAVPVRSESKKTEVDHGA
ncbi:MAG: TolC family protein [Myxococcales bacterium]|nr:TolC family protein [Myxococcales bacterium]